jgi:hypothetical protein
MSREPNEPEKSAVVVANQAGAAQLTVLAAPTTTNEFNTIGERLVPKGCFKVEDVLFDFGSSFVRPEIGAHLPKLAQLRTDNKIQDPTTGADIFPPLSVFGHADPVGPDDFNKQLSGRRATAIYAMLVRDTDLWERLFSNPLEHDNWGTRSVQTMLSTVQKPIEVNGVAGGETREAIRTFQSSNGLGVDGIAGRQTRKVLFRAYMDALCGASLELDKVRDFLGRNRDKEGKADFQGCGKFNQLLLFSQAENTAFERADDKTERNNENAPNRRVMILLFAPGRRVNPAVWPCPRADEGVAACKKRFFPDADVRRSFQAKHREFENTKDTFACRFYQIITDDSPCERVKPLPFPPIPDLDVVSPVVFFPEADTAAEPATTRAALVGAAGAPATPSAPSPITPATKNIVVKKPQTKAARVDVDLKTDKPFDGIGTFDVSPKDKIQFSLGSKPLTFNGKDNVFTGDELRVGVTLFAEAVKASLTVDDVTLTLTLSRGTKRAGPPATAKMTAVEITLDICEPRTTTAADPPALPQPPATTPPANAKPKDKIFGGRALPIRNEPKIADRAILFIRQIKPSNFKGNLVLTALSDQVKAFAREFPEDDDNPLPKRHVFPASNAASSDRKFFAEGFVASTKVRDTGFQLGIEGLQEDADRVAVTVVRAEIVSNVEPKDVHTIVRIPEKPERTSRSKFFPAPVIIGVNYDVQLRPHTEIPQPKGPFDPLKFQWSSSAPAAQLSLTDATKDIVKLKANKISRAQDDMTITLIGDSDVGKFKVTHKLTAVNVEIDPVSSGDIPSANDDINLIKNPSATPILQGADASDPKQAPIIQITKIQPDLGWTDDDPRIAWWIIGGEPAEADKAKYEGRANFLNDENAKRGKKIQIVGDVNAPDVGIKSTGDILVQPYSGGFAYGMFRTHVVELKKIKYRVNRIFTNAVPASPGKPGIKARVPTQEHPAAKRHIKVANIYLRQLGILLIPDDSAEAASSAGNPKVGLDELKGKVVAVNRVEPGHFDVEVNDQRLTFSATDSNGDRAVRINARNEVIVFAYIHSLQQTDPKETTLAQAQVLPVNHAPKARTDPPRAYSRASFTLSDKGVPSSSLIKKTGIPGSTPVSEVKMVVIDAVGVKKRVGTGPANSNSDINHLWGISVPTFNIDDKAGNTDIVYANTMAHELGHVLGLGHRDGPPDRFRDGLVTPKDKNIMHPDSSPPTAENFDIIQAKAIRFSEVTFRNP